MVAIVTLNFGICWLPTHIIAIISYVYENNQRLEALHYLLKIIANTLSYLTPVINPCVYAFYNENFRIPLIDLCKKITCRQDKQFMNRNSIKLKKKISREDIG